MMNETDKRIFIIIAVCFFVVLLTSTVLKGIPGVENVGYVAIGIMMFIGALLVLTSPKPRREGRYPPSGGSYQGDGGYEDEYDKETKRLEAREDYYNTQRMRREEERRRNEEDRKIRQMQQEYVSYDPQRVDKNLKKYAGSFFAGFGNKKGKRIKVY